MTTCSGLGRPVRGWSVRAVGRANGRPVTMGDPRGLCKTLKSVTGGLPSPTPPPPSRAVSLSFHPFNIIKRERASHLYPCAADGFLRFPKRKRRPKIETCDQYPPIPRQYPAIPTYTLTNTHQYPLEFQGKIHQSPQIIQAKIHLYRIYGGPQWMRSAAQQSLRDRTCVWSGRDSQ